MSGKLLALASLAADNVAAHALAYAAACAPLLCALAPWLAGAAVAEGLRREGLAAVDAGPDVTVVGRALGRQVALDPSLAEHLRAVSGVARVERRVVGAVQTDGIPVLLVGVEPERLAGAAAGLRGAAPKSAGECLAGAELARELGLRPGSRVALDGAWTRVYTVSGILGAQDALAGSKALVVGVEEAQALFQDPRVSEFLVWTLPGCEREVARAAESDAAREATTRAELRASVQQAADARGGALSLLSAPLVALAAASFCALSWFAGARRKVEIAACKLAGFSGGDVLIVLLAENLLVALALASLALLAAWIWVRLLGAALLAPFLVPDLALFPAQMLPAAFTPLPAGLAFAVSFCACAAGSMFASWRLALARTAGAFA